MKSFIEYLKEKKVQKQSPDPAEARSLFLQAEARLTDLKSLPIHETNASFRFEAAYEAIREALQAFLAREGYKPFSHEAVFAFAFESKLLSEKEMHRVDLYREIRNDVNYRATPVTLQEAKDIISFATNILPALREKLQ